MAEAGPAPAGFDIRRILLLAGVGAVILVALLFFLFRGCAPGTRGGSGYTVIYSNLELKDAANVIARLKELAIPYEIGDEGQSVAVPKSRADEARLGLAEKNLPMGGVVGWEIFDEARLGATDFDRRIQLIRAISGELSRTIQKIQAVEAARVQIVLPETRLFAETVAPVTASVMLRLNPGTELIPQKVNGIIHLVASSVENLQTENVTVVDNTGRILSGQALKVQLKEIAYVPKEITPKEEITITEEVVAKVTQPPLTAEEKMLLMVKAKKELEKDLGGKAQEILNQFYPPNSTIIKVDLELENGNKGDKFAKDQLMIKKISAIILIDNRVDLPAELKQATFKSVAAAIGYNRKRGDRIVLQKVPFHLATPPPAVIKSEVDKVLPPDNGDKPPILPTTWLRNIMWLLAIVGVFFVVILLFRALRRKPKEPVVKEGFAEVTPAPVAAPAKASAVDNIRAAVDQNPERIAELLRSWLSS